MDFDCVVASRDGVPASSDTVPADLDVPSASSQIFPVNHDFVPVNHKVLADAADPVVLSQHLTWKALECARSQDDVAWSHLSERCSGS